MDYIGVFQAPSDQNTLIVQSIFLSILKAKRDPVGLDDPTQFQL